MAAYPVSLQSALSSIHSTILSFESSSAGSHRLCRSSQGARAAIQRLDFCEQGTDDLCANGLHAAAVVRVRQYFSHMLSLALAAGSCPCASQVCFTLKIGHWLSAVPMSLRPKGEIQGDFRLTLGNHPPSLSLDHKCCFARQSNVCLGDGAPLESKHRRLCGKALQLPLTNWDKTRYIFAGKFTH